MPPPVTRRQFVTAMSAGIGLGLSGCKDIPVSEPIFSENPFKLGIASGDPNTDGFVIWTRLLPDLDNSRSLAGQSIWVDWQLATDEYMQDIVRSGRELASPDWGHSVHVEIEGLEAGQSYWYRFESGGERSQTGRCITFPQDPSQLRFAVASCQNYESGFYGAYQHMARDELDFVLFLGDYIYEDNKDDPQSLRQHTGPEPETIDQYRDRLVQYKSDPDLQLAHAAMPWLATWDDHEVDNDYANLDNYQDVDKALFAQRRAAAYQAYYEHMPLRRAQRPVGHSALMYRGFEFGDLASLSITDLRQYRDNQACRVPGLKPGRPVSNECAERLEEERTMLGQEQETWLEQRLNSSGSQWNIIAQQQYVNPLRQKDADGNTVWWADDWNGYPAARERLLNNVKDSQAKNPVFLAGDIHSYWAIGIPSDRNDFNSDSMASEFVTGAISSTGPPYDYFMSLMADNPHIRFFESRVQGYTVCTVNREKWRTDFYQVETNQRERPARALIASFEVEPDKPFPRRV